MTNKFFVSFFALYGLALVLIITSYGAYLCGLIEMPHWTFELATFLLTSSLLPLFIGGSIILFGSGSRSRK